jgi:hypothetical protein
MDRTQDMERIWLSMLAIIAKVKFQLAAFFAPPSI